MGRGGREQNRYVKNNGKIILHIRPRGEMACVEPTVLKEFTMTKVELNH